MKKLKRSGMSITEMCVVLAVVAIASIVVVSFTLMVGARSSASAAKLNALNDLTLSRNTLLQWVDEMQRLDAQIAADESGLSAKIGTEIYQVTLQEGKLTASLPEEKELTCLISVVQEMEFDALEANGKTLYFCTIHYSVQNPMGEQVPFEETFTLFSRVGLTV